MAWFQLIIAGLLETFWSYQLKCSAGFTKLLPSVLTILGMLASFYLLSQALKYLPLSIGYAVWTGIGTIGAALLGFAVLKEPVSAMKLVCILLIAAGIVGLNWSSLHK